MKIEEAVFENRSINDVTFMRLVGVDSKREKRSGVLLNLLAWTSGYVDAVDDQVWEKMLSNICECFRVIWVYIESCTIHDVLVRTSIFSHLRKHNVSE